MDDLAPVNSLVPRRILVVVGAGLLASLVMTSCETTEDERRRKRTLPGQGEISTLGWGRAQPGDAQPGIGAFPQSR